MHKINEIIIRLMIIIIYDAIFRLNGMQGQSASAVTIYMRLADFKFIFMGYICHLKTSDKLLL